MRSIHAFLVIFTLLATTLPAIEAQAPPAANLGNRIVPEALETNRYILYSEWRGMLERIESAAPDFVEVIEIGESFGWTSPLSGSHEHWPIVAVEITNENSATPRDEKPAVVFILSIHGNEKGGREGGFRVIEDLAMPLGYGADYRDLLDDVVVVFAFPNVDGWVHAELGYRGACANYVAVPASNPVTGECVETQGFVRTNGNKQDLNRDWPSLGWYETRFGREHALSEPEIEALEAYLIQFRGRTLGAVDIHGMLTPSDGGVEGVPLLDQGSPAHRSTCLPADPPVGSRCPIRDGHFALGLMTGGDAAQTHGTVRVSERMKERLDAMAESRHPVWANAPNLGVAGGAWFEWGTGWDTIGYTDSGFTDLWLSQFLLAPGGTIELSYNHITFDDHYIPTLNDMHVESTREIVKAFLDVAAERIRPRLEPSGTIAVLADDRVVTGNTLAFDGPHHDPANARYVGEFSVTPQRFWSDLAKFMPAGSVVTLSPADVAAGRLAGHTSFVVTDRAWDLLEERAGAVDAVRAYAESGGRVLLTDAALKGLESFGVASAGSVDVGTAYLGYIDLDLTREHDLTRNVRGLARQTYEGIALGYPTNSAPVWTVAAGALSGGDVAGTTFGADRASLGRAPLGAGEVVFIGALLPTSTAEHYVPYGLADYQVTYTGYELVYNALGISLVEAAWTPDEDVTPAADEDAGRGIPAVGPGSILAAVASAAVMLTRHRSGLRTVCRVCK